MKAPRPMDSPAPAATRPAPITTSRLAATNSSSLRALATDRIMGRSRSRPATARMSSPTTRGTSASSTSAPDPWAPLPSTVSTTKRGATARSWNSSTENTARPAGDCSRFFSARAGSATAVEDRATARPRIVATRG